MVVHYLNRYGRKYFVFMDTIAIVDFGGQYAHLIANRIRRLGVYSEIVQPDNGSAGFRKYRGVILSGGPHSVTESGSPSIQRQILSLGIPILGLCYGHQLIARLLGGTVSKGEKREFGRADLHITAQNPLFKGLADTQQIWMSHGDAVELLPGGFEPLGFTADCSHAAIGDLKRNIFGLQFHPEVTDTPRGMEILDNFIDICGCRREWNSDAFLREIKANIARSCGDKKVFMLVSGGVDSTVAFALCNIVLGTERVLGLHIDNGLMRCNESRDVVASMKQRGFHNLHTYDASEEFLTALAGVVDPEEKRRIIGDQFVKVMERAQARLNLNTEEWLLAQGTIYPDTIESAGTKHADKIKTHHNRVAVIVSLIEKGLVIEPLAQLYKDEVRNCGAALGLPHDFLWRHPFPGPGLGVRVLCSDGTGAPPEKKVEQEVMALAKPCGYEACILPVRSVGVQGDSRTYVHPVLVTGGLDWPLLERVSTAITNRVREVNRVVFGVSVHPDRRYAPVKASLTAERIGKLRALDHRVTAILRQTGEYETVWQMPVVLLPLVNSAGGECVVLRPIASQEAMTARFFPLKDETIRMIAEAAREIAGIGDIFYDVTHKPPATIEWE